jgi:hypothetical protein
MPGCSLAVTGADFDVDLFLSNSPWKGVASVFRRGQVTGSNLRPVRKNSGFIVEVSPADQEQLEPQILDATRFIQDNLVEMERLSVFPGVEEIELGIGLFWFEDTACYPLSLPSTFMLLAGRHGITTTLYVYAASADSNA